MINNPIFRKGAKITDFNCGILTTDAKNGILPPYECFPIEGYEIPVHRETGEMLPNCCVRHQSIYQNLLEWLDTFPYCCEKHQEMAKSWKFDRVHLKNLALKIVTQLSYTEYHIEQKINSENWYQDITDYIEYNLFSFGHPNIGADKYLQFVKHYAECTSFEIPKRKREILLNYLNYNGERKGDKIDINDILETYQRWLEVFPFDLPYFKGIKAHFEKNIPLIEEGFSYNPYMKSYRSKMVNHTFLAEYLCSKTKELLRKCDSSILLKEGLIVDIQAYSIDLLNNKRKVKLEEDLNNKLKYTKILSNWLKSELKYFKEYAEIINPPSHKTYNIGNINNANFL